MNNAINLVECTPRWPVAQLQTAMQKHGHVTRRFILKGSALGDLYGQTSVCRARTSIGSSPLQPAGGFL